MVVRLAGAVALLLAISTTTHAQHGGDAPALRSAPAEAKQFAFLVGQFELVVRPKATTLVTKIHGVPKLVGTWTGWRALDGFGIEDDLRITDRSGNPRAFSHTVRYYDVATHHWINSAIDPYRGVFTTGTAEWKDNAMIVTSRGTDTDGKAYVSRVLYTEITPTSFKFRQDRSSDDGRTWDEGVLTIEAKRVAAGAPRQ
jgi:hypothetical protein